jgi:hypothetical protein
LQAASTTKGILFSNTGSLVLVAPLRLIAMLLLLVLPQAAESAELAVPEALPRFADFPVKVYHGPFAKPILEGEWRQEHPELYRISRRNRVMAAGHYMLVISTCGSSCQSPDLIDARTGRPLPVPSVSGWRKFPDDFNPVLTRPDSRLIVLQGGLNDKNPNGVHYFVVEDGKLKHLRTIETDGNFSKKPKL